MSAIGIIDHIDDRWFAEFKREMVSDSHLRLTGAAVETRLAGFARLRRTRSGESRINLQIYRALILRENSAVDTLSGQGIWGLFAFRRRFALTLNRQLSHEIQFCRLACIGHQRIDARVRLLAAL